MAKFKRYLYVISASSFLLPIVSPALEAAENVSVLGAKPKWSVLENYQETITQDEFARLLQDVYCTHGFADDLFKIDNQTARILKTRAAQSFFTLRFATDEASRQHVPRLWRPATSLPPTKSEEPLATLRIALDPGHLGGKWAKMEERWYKVGESTPVQEGDLTLRTARILAAKLKRLGAKVLFVRSTAQPITPKRPEVFKEVARKNLIQNARPHPGPE